MNAAQKFVISASRRTDIPAFYMDWFMGRIEKGTFKIKNPYNQKVTVIPAGSDRVHSIVFWSKDFGPFLAGNFGDRLQRRGYHLYFNFTINSASDLLEPNVPPLDRRLKQLDTLCRGFGAEAVAWRFDPLCFYRTGRGKVEDNRHDFKRIAERAARAGVQRCITSFWDDYPKIRRRTAAVRGFGFLLPSLEEQKNIVLEMESELKPLKMDLYLCCEKELLGALPSASRVANGSCIPNDYLVKLFGGSLSFKRDRGQRVKAGCGCRVSVDIGSYRQQPCFHNCLFCYANPADRGQRKK